MDFDEIYVHFWALSNHTVVTKSLETTNGASNPLTFFLLIFIEFTHYYHFFLHSHIRIRWVSRHFYVRIIIERLTT